MEAQFARRFDLHRLYFDGCRYRVSFNEARQIR